VIVNPQEPHQPPVSEEEALPLKPVPQCPNCGWHDVRIARTKNVLDTILSPISIQRFKCRSCGHYFRRLHRPE
jgi:transposase-like protein